MSTCFKNWAISLVCEALIRRLRDMDLCFRLENCLTSAVTCFLVFDLDMELLNAVASGLPDVNRFVTIMAICNTVIPMQR